MKLHTDYKIINITNKDLKLKDEFTIKVKILTYKENLSIIEAFEGEDNSIKMLEVAKQIFVNSVIDWVNITDMEDKPLECSTENKSLVFDFDPEFCNKIITFATSKVQEDKKK